MANARNIDIKLLFSQYDCQPNFERYEAFELQLYAHGGRSDEHGWSLADHLMGIDDGGPTGTALAPPTTADGRAAVKLHRKRAKESHTARFVKFPGLSGIGHTTL